VNVSCLWFTNIELKHAYLLLKMPSKAYNRRKRYKEKYNINIDVARTSAAKRYKEIREDKLQQAKIKWVADKQLRKRQRSATQRTRDGNGGYKERNRAKSLQNTKRRLQEDEDYRMRNKQRSLVNTKLRLQEDEDYYMRNKQRSFVNTKRRLQEDEDYRMKNKNRSFVYTKRRLQEDAQYRLQNKRKALERIRRKRQDANFRSKDNAKRCSVLQEKYKGDETYRERVRNSEAKRLQETTYRQTREECKRTAARKRRLHPEQQNEENEHRRNRRFHGLTNSYNTCRIAGQPTISRKKDGKKVAEAKVKYWIRRSRVLAQCRTRIKEFRMRQVMMQRSNVSRLKVDLLFNKAAKCISAGLAKLKRLHNYMQNKAESSLEQLPEHRPVTEDELTAALNGTRVHTSSSEPYFWEHSSRPLPPCNSIPVDTAG